VKRPEYVHCIRSYHETQKHTSLCGRDISMEFNFHDVSHASHGGRLMCCPECAAAAKAALDAATWRATAHNEDDNIEITEGDRVVYIQGKGVGK
jgi:uncharacterized Zn ribbon protein